MIDELYQQEINELRKIYNVKPIEIQVFNCLTSTNVKLWELIEQNINIPIAIVALQQTTGKGQWGKSWKSELGGLYLSVALKCDLALENSFDLVMSTAVGIVNLLRDYQLPVTIKWSNDLILEDRKLGGIKIETKTNNNLIKYAVVGVGINWTNPVPDIGINLQSYYQQQHENQQLTQIKSLEQLTAITTVGILQGYQNYQQLGKNFIYQQYKNLINSISQKIVIDRQLGTIVSVSPQGKLQVRFQSPGAVTNVYLSPGEISLGYDFPAIVSRNENS